MKSAKPRPIETLYLAAHASELKPLVDLGRKYALIRDDIAYLAAGIGPVAAAFGLTHFLEDYRPGRIIAVGTAGVINEKKFQIGDVALAGSVATASGLDAVYTPKPQPQRIVLSSRARSPRPKADPIKDAATAPLRLANVYAPQEITRDAEWILPLRQAGHDIEHLEAFAYAFVAKKFRIPIAIVLGLTNVIGPAAHRDWLKNARPMLQKTCRMAETLS